MSPLLRRARPRRAAAAADDPATGETRVLPLAEEAPAPAPAEPRPVPAGVAPEELIGDRPDTRRRGRLRRRLRHLRQVRELVLRDVGGLLYEVHRAGGDGAGREHGMELVQGKLERLAALDAERVELEAVLGDRRAETVLREPGVGGTCPTCGDYFASDARFCSACGTRVDGRGEAAAPRPRAGDERPADPAPAEGRA
jgi:hypothetical protein